VRARALLGVLVAALLGACGGAAHATATNASRPEQTATCRSARLAVDWGHAEGDVILDVSVFDTARASCVLRGWPHVGLSETDGRPLPTTQTPSKTEPAALVHLTPDNQGSAMFVIGWSNWCGSASAKAARVYVTLPGSEALLVAPIGEVGLPRCDYPHRPSDLSVGPVLSGSR
jgi:hypothetical protein